MHFVLAALIECANELKLRTDAGILGARLITGQARVGAVRFSFHIKVEINHLLT